MKTRILTLLSVCIMALTSCTGTRTATAGSEVDDVYYNRDDRRADQASADQARAQAEAARVEPTDNESNYSNDRYDQGLADKNGETESTYDKKPYADDDYYYSRQVRRFTSTSWNYYDPYYSYDPYYAIGTSSWSSYSNRPWWYDPYYYNGPSYAWTSNWGNGGYNYYPSQCFWNQTNNYGNYGFGSGFSIGIGSGYGSGFGYSPFGAGYGGYPGYGGYGGYGGFGGYGNYYGGNGGYGGYGYYGGGCAPGYYGGNTYFGNGGSTSTTNVVNAPRNSPSSLNTSGRPGNQPVLNPRETRPYQGNFPVTVTQTRPKTDLNNTGRGSQPVVRPSNNQPNPTLSRPNTDTEGYSRPANDTYSRPTINSGTSRPTNDSYSRPRIDNGSSRPHNDTYSAPSRNFESRPSNSTPTFSAPSHSGGGLPSGGGGGGAVHRPR